MVQSIFSFRNQHNFTAPLQTVTVDSLSMNWNDDTRCQKLASYATITNVLIFEGPSQNSVKYSFAPGMRQHEKSIT